MRFPFKPTSVPPDHVLYEYWREEGYFRPTVDILVHGPKSVSSQLAVLDSGSPYIVFDLAVAADIGLPGPFRRRVSAQGVGGAEVNLVFPEDREVQLLLSDFISEWAVWTPLVGFVEGNRPGARRSGILGFTGFFQYFAVDYPDDIPIPVIDVKLKQSFPGHKGRGRPPRDVWQLLKRG
jgi:hypothetical protein